MNDMNKKESVAITDLPESNTETNTETNNVAVLADVVENETVTMSNENEVNQVVSEDSDSQVVNANKSSNLVRNYAIAGAVLIVMSGGLWYVLEQQGRVQTNFFASVLPDKAVAKINGVKISKSEFERNRNQIMISAEQQGADINSPEVASQISNQAIDTLVNTELLRQAAQKAGIIITPEDVDNRYDEIIESVGGQEVLSVRMAEIGIDMDGLRKDIEGELLIQKLFEREVDTTGVVVTEEEVSQIYTQAGGLDAGLPPLADVRAEIETNIRFSKEQELVAAYIEELRVEAKIEVLIK